MFVTSHSHVLITGGSSGIGYGLAARFADAGATVLVTERDAARLDSVRQRRPSLRTFVGDIGVPADREALARHVRTIMPELNVVINNAGIQRSVSLAADHAPPGANAKRRSISRWRGSPPQPPVNPGHAFQRKAEPDRERHVRRRLCAAAVRADLWRLQSRTAQLYDHSSARVARYEIARRRTHTARSRDGTGRPSLTPSAAPSRLKSRRPFVFGRQAPLRRKHAEAAL